MQLIRGIVDPRVELKLSEVKDKSLVDGENIIGVMEGNFFVPGGVSRNKRFYSKNLWNRTLSNEGVKEKLANRGMYGTIGHDTPVNDESLSKGLLTHITDKLYIDGKGNGIGRALILNTPSGRNLKTVLGAGGKVYVSSRAMGTFEGKTSHGVPKVKEDDYELKGFDAVLDPGFLEANPTLKESLEYPEDSFKSMINECYSILEDNTDEPDEVLNEEKEITNIEEKYEMDKQIAETIKMMTEESVKVKSALDESLKDKEKVDAENSVLQSDNESLRTQLKEQEDDMAKKKKDDEEEDEKEKEEAKVKAEAARTTLESILKFMEQDEEEDDDEEEKKKKKEKEAAAVEAFKKFTEDVGTVKQIQTALETLESQLDANKEFEKTYGTHESIIDLLAKYEILGEKHVSTEKASEAESLANELSIPKEKIEALLGKGFDNEAIKEFFKDMKESLKVKHTYGGGRIDAKNDSKDKSPFGKSIGERVLGGMKFNSDDREETPFNENETLGESVLKELV